METKTKKHAGGRPSILTDVIANEVISNLESGSYINVACIAAGISEQTFYNWLERGDNADYDKAPIYRNFRIRALRAVATAEVGLLKECRTGDPKRSTACMMIMSRRWPERWRERSESSLDLTSKGKQINPSIIFQVVNMETKDMVTRLQNGERTNMETVKDIPGEQSSVPPGQTPSA